MIKSKVYIKRILQQQDSPWIAILKWTLVWIFVCLRVPSLLLVQYWISWNNILNTKSIYWNWDSLSTEIFRCDFQEVHFISSKRFTKVSSQLEAGIYEYTGWTKQSKTYTMSAGNLALGLANDRKICLQSVLVIVYDLGLFYFLQCVTSAIDPVPAFLI